MANDIPYIPVTRNKYLLEQIKNFTETSSARNVLGVYANNRVKELGICSKAIKFDFPFCGPPSSSRKSFTRLVDMVEKHLRRKIPYILQYSFLVQVLNRPKVHLNLRAPDDAGADFRQRPLTPANTKFLGAIRRYCNKLNDEMEAKKIPLHIFTTDFERAGYGGVEPRLYLVLQIEFTQVEAGSGYRLLRYLPEIEKVLSTLHRYGDNG